MVTLELYLGISILYVHNWTPKVQEIKQTWPNNWQAIYCITENI